MLALRGASYTVRGRGLLRGVSLAAAPGRILALVGPNGAGKTTALKLLAGDLAPTGGEALLDGRAVTAWPWRALARRRAVLPQHSTLAFEFRVHEIVEMGLAAHEGKADPAESVIGAMRAADVLQLVDRSYLSLSGGEQQRVQLARVLAQIWPSAARAGEPAAYLLLDEPTASLDLSHQVAILTEARNLAARGIGIVVILHDLNIAARFADEVALLDRGRLVASGVPAAVLTAHRLEEVFAVPLAVFAHPHAAGRLIVATV
ncbi:MAG: heme ABC transporter ATP-binding protein [Proteobacteria bacterium]|nr:heme ABC transporter ATP-binding protein [Pseudomonadota bacterium]